MKTFITFIAVLITLTSLAQSDRWYSFEKSWDRYIADPTHENAVKVYEQLPNEPLTKGLPGEKLIAKLYRDWPHVGKKIVAENREAAGIGFKLYAIADGGFKEDIGVDLGKLIVKNATLFLQELKKHRQLVQNLEGIVCNYGVEYVDRADLQMEETDRRMRLLVNVNDATLEDVKAECLKALMSRNADKVVYK